jgi:hypothetical protein
LHGRKIDQLFDLLFQPESLAVVHPARPGACQWE